MTKEQWSIAACKFAMLYPKQAAMIREAADNGKRSQILRFSRRSSTRLYEIMADMGIMTQTPLKFLRGLKAAYKKMDDDEHALRIFLSTEDK